MADGKGRPGSCERKIILFLGSSLYFLCCSETDEAVELVENVSAREITIYTLYSQEYLENTIRQFENEYPGIKINLEIGREEGSNTTFLSCYREENGEIYAIPSQFGVTMISAPSDSMDSLNSLEGLAEYIQNSPCPNPEYGNDLNIYDVTGLFQTLYPAYSHRIFGNGESYDRQELEKFVSGFKEVWDALMEHTTDEQIQLWKNLVEVTGTWQYYNVADRSNGLVDVNYYYGLYVENMQAESGRSIGLYNFNYYSDIFYLIYMTREYEHETYDVLAYDDVKTFTPLMVYSINAKSENMDTAEQFIKYMLSTKVQSKIAMGYYIGNGEHPYGMPVNSSLTEFTIPDSVKSICEDAFLDCSDMTVYYSGDTLDAYIDSYSSDWEANHIVWVRQ